MIFSPIFPDKTRSGFWAGYFFLQKEISNDLKQDGTQGTQVTQDPRKDQSNDQIKYQNSVQAGRPEKEVQLQMVCAKAAVSRQHNELGQETRIHAIDRTIQQAWVGGDCERVTNGLG